VNYGLLDTKWPVLNLWLEILASHSYCPTLVDKVAVQGRKKAGSEQHRVIGDMLQLEKSQQHKQKTRACTDVPSPSKVANSTRTQTRAPG
jgi:hypothetical protein